MKMELPMKDTTYDLWDSLPLKTSKTQMKLSADETLSSTRKDEL